MSDQKQIHLGYSPAELLRLHVTAEEIRRSNVNFQQLQIDYILQTLNRAGVCTIDNHDGTFTHYYLPNFKS